MKKESINTFFAVGLFAAAMGLLETAVVFYLRKLFYPAGFSFPLKGYIDPEILNVEWIREISTIIMLAAVSYLAAKKTYEKIAYFLYAFAVWDIFYYISLKILLNWPSSFFDWDLLFMIPWPWVGPVIAPLIFSALFIILAAIIIKLSDKGKEIRLSKLEITLFMLSILITLYTWLIDYGKLIFSKDYGSFINMANNPEFVSAVSAYVPTSYNWPLFILSAALALAGIILVYLRNSSKKR